MKRTQTVRPLTSIVLLVMVVVILIVGGIVLFRFYEREHPQLSLLNEVSRVGLVKSIELVLSDKKSGLRDVTVRLVQGSRDVTILERSYERSGLFKQSGPSRVIEEIPFEAKKLKLKDGSAELVITVHDSAWCSWWRGNTTERSYPLVIDTVPPLVQLIDSPRYVNPGGAGLVTYKISEEVGRHGVSINGFVHPGFPLTRKGEGIYGALIGLEYNTLSLDQAQIFAVDLAGNESVRPFGMILRKPQIKEDLITISEGFLNLKLPEFRHYYPDLGAGEPVDQYLEINQRVRKENNEEIRKVCAKSRPDQLWQGTFKRLARSSRRAGYAEARTYYYQDKEIDHQVHLGIDLASTKNAEVAAANGGEVVFAGYLGIYGNMVIIDHGLGLFTLYSHLSQIVSQVGDMVNQETVIGLTGMSGMAGGDHLHFSVLINGIFVNPLEWWDAQWLELHIMSAL
ncbi:MAG: M23 family metallopeptidase [Proteobacteria bacterium]|nr:M23 family metallopeptidase [Pseudomonadota bacterium]MBU1688233.1 M23 family metallopeptidase [Pseudomonadota bacterium]